MVRQASCIERTYLILLDLVLFEVLGVNISINADMMVVSDGAVCC